jgi:hypothetical protein
MRFVRFGPGRGEGEPTPEQVRAWQRRMSAPENEVPGSAGVSVVLARTAAVAVAVGEVQGFTTGVRFTLMVRARAPLPGGMEHRLFELVSGRPRSDRRLPPQEQLLLGVEFADGRQASTLDVWREPWGEDAAGGDDVVLSAQGGGGGGLSVDQTYWVSPLPPAGTLTFVLAWGAFGIAETRAVVDAGQVLAASACSLVLWEPQFEPPVEPVPPARPGSGWFAAGPATPPDPDQAPGS